MATYMMTGRAAVTMSSGPVTIGLRVDGGGRARLEAELGAGGPPVPPATRPRGDLLILPAVAAEVVVRVVPVGADRFPAGAVVHADVSVGSGPQSERAVLGAIDVAGLATRDLVRLTPSGQSIAVSAAVEDPLPRLGELGDAALVALAEILQVKRVEPLSAVNVVIAVDESASFRLRVEDGSARAALDVLAALGFVLAPERQLAAATVGAAVTRIPALAPEELAERALDSLGERPRSSGLRAGTSGLLGSSPSGATVTYLLTDSVPADLAAFEAADEVDGEARHLVVLGEPSAWDLQRHPAVPHTFVATVPGESLERTLTTDPGALRALVRSLLAGCFAPGTAAYERSAL